MFFDLTIIIIIIVNLYIMFSEPCINIILLLLRAKIFSLMLAAN